MENQHESVLRKQWYYFLFGFCCRFMTFKKKEEFSGGFEASTSQLLPLDPGRARGRCWNVCAITNQNNWDHQASQSGGGGLGRFGGNLHDKLATSRIWELGVLVANHNNLYPFPSCCQWEKRYWLISRGVSYNKLWAEPSPVSCLYQWLIDWHRLLTSIC